MLFRSCLKLTLVSFSISIFTFFYRVCMFNSLRICAQVVLIVGSTKGGKTSLKSRYLWGGIFYLFHDLLRDEKLTEE